MFPVDLTELISIAGYPGIFAIIFAESGTVIGFFLPGASLLFTSGILASQDYLNIWILIPLVATAAVLGDNVGYWFGAKIGVHVFARPDSRFFKRAYLEKTRRFYARYGARTILFARFIPMVRTFAPMLAGVAGMHYPTFMLYNVIGGFLWAGGVSLAGYTLATALPDVAENLELLILGIIVLTLISLVREVLVSRREFDGVEAAIFDLDGTLAAPFSRVEPAMIERLAQLLSRMRVAIVSGATFARLKRDVLAHLDPELFPNLTLFPENGGSAYRWDGAWRKAYDESIDDTERETIRAALKDTIAQMPEFQRPPHGETMVDRGAYIAFTALGAEAPREMKDKWDPTALKRRAFIRLLQTRLPGYDIFIGGTTTIDVMRKGINKAHGIRQLLSWWGLPPAHVAYFGDALYPGGNDFPVVETGVDTRQVQSPAETAALIDKLLAERNPGSSRT